MTKILHLLNLFVLLCLTPLAAQTTFTLPSLSANCGETIQIPVTVESFDSLLGIQLIVEWDATVLDYIPEAANTSFLPGIISLINDSSIQFTWQDTLALSLPQDTLFVISLRVFNATNPETSIVFSNDKSDIDIISTNGTVEPILNNGTVSFLSNNIPVAINCQDTVFQYTTATTCEVEGIWTEPIFESCTGSGSFIISSTHDIGTNFEVGSRMITYTASDEFGNMGTCSFIHIVQDTIAPVISNCPDNLEVNFSKDAGCDLSVTWSAPDVLERCSASETEVTSSMQPGSFFPVGITMVTYTATDAAGNSSSDCTFEVVVTGSDPITFDIQPENVSIAAEVGLCGATYDWGGPPSAVSGCAPIELVSNIPPGSFFPVGTTVVEYVATDEIEQRAVWSFSVTVEDTQPLSVNCPTDIIVEANGTIQSDSAGFLNSVNVTACGNYELSFSDLDVIDNCTSSIQTELLAGNDKDFTLGDTQMQYVISNDSGEEVTCSFQVSIMEQPAVFANRSESLTCVDTEVQLLAIVDVDGFYDLWQWTGPAGYTSTEKEPTIYLTPERAGVYKVVATSSISGCSAEAETIIEVLGEEGIPLIETGELIVCEGTSLFLGTTVTPGATYTWTGPNNFTSNEISINIESAEAAQTGNYELTRTVDGCTSAPANARLIVLSELVLEDDVIGSVVNSTTDFNVLMNDSIALDAPFTITVTPEPTSGALINNGDGTFSYTPNEGFTGTEQLSYEVCYETCSDLCDTGILNIRTELSDDLCTYPSYLSPNGDEQNDRLILSCNSSDPESGIIIFNQWGAKIYESFPYNNDWDGTYKGKELPDGTYFYIYKNSRDDMNAVKNCLTIFR